MSEDTIDPAVLPEAPTPAKQYRGFAAMDPEKRRAIAAKGGGSVSPSNRSFARDKELAASAGRKGGEASRGGGRPKREEA
jgi:general stress protein YciG